MKIDAPPPYPLSIAGLNCVWLLLVLLGEVVHKISGQYKLSFTEVGLGWGGWVVVVESNFSVQLRPKLNNTLEHNCHIWKSKKVATKLPPFAVLSTLLLVDQNC